MDNNVYLEITMEKQEIEIKFAENEDYLWLKEHDRHMTVQKIENEEVYVIKKNGEIIGWLRFNLFWDCVPFMNLIELKEEYRNKGIGTMLVKHWEEKMKEKGYNDVLTSTQSDEDAQHFYRKIGYSEIGGFKFRKDPYEIIFHKGI